MNERVISKISFCYSPRHGLIVLGVSVDITVRGVAEVVGVKPVSSTSARSLECQASNLGPTRVERELDLDGTSNSK